jgi:DIS3-like exonuclease 2
MERRIYYEDTEGLSVEWFSVTCTVILDLVQRSSKKEKQVTGRALTEVAYIVNPANSVDLSAEAVAKLVQTDETKEVLNEDNNDADIKPEPAVLPLTLRLLAPVPVQVYAMGGDNKPFDIGVRLYLSSYLE